MNYGRQDEPWRNPEQKKSADCLVCDQSKITWNVQLFVYTQNSLRKFESQLSLANLFREFSKNRCDFAWKIEFNHNITFGLKRQALRSCHMDCQSRAALSCANITRSIGKWLGSRWKNKNTVISLVWKNWMLRTCRQCSAWNWTERCIIPGASFHSQAKPLSVIYG